MISQATFNEFVKQGYNRIPLIREVLADLDTPLSIYLKFYQTAPYSYLFESVHGGEQWGRYSIIGLPSKKIITVKGHTVVIKERNGNISQYDVRCPLAEIERIQNSYKSVTIDGLPNFHGGLVGYFAYETIGYIEERLNKKHKPDPIDTPDILLMVSDELIIFDNLRGKLYLVVHPELSDTHAFDKASERLTELAAGLSSHNIVLPATATSDNTEETDFISGFTQRSYEAAVAKIKRYITAGDVMQVVLSQRLSVPFEAAPINLYRALRCLNPSPYLYFLNLDSFQIVGSSPEILVRLQDNVVTVRPIAGTRPRGQTAAEDSELERELRHDPKELAEHLMLIDLGRNDISRVAKVGSVKLTDNMQIERYSHVMHIVSNVTGALKPDLNAIDVLKATFPAGTVSGAPKIRAMEIIDELEPVKRGIYSGAIGYLAWNGNMDLAIAIRTAVIKNKQLHIQAGGGIVADSIPENEWHETMNKARAIVKSVNLVGKGMT